MSVNNKWFKSDTVFRITLAMVIVGVFICFQPFNYHLATADETSQQEISASDNSALWDEANQALSNFLSDGLDIFNRSSDQLATEQELTVLSGYIDDFSVAVNTLAGVVPPPEQATIHRALLPVYQEMFGHMAGIRDSMLSNDPWKLDLEWHKLALLLNETSEVLQILNLKSAPTPVTTPTPAPASTGGQPAVRKDGSVTLGQFEILSSGSRLTPEGFVVVFLAIFAVIFLVAGRVFAFRLRRRYGRSPAHEPKK